MALWACYLLSFQTGIRGGHLYIFGEIVPRLGLNDYRVRFNRIEDQNVDVEKEQGIHFNLLKLLEYLQYDEDNIQLQRGSEEIHLVPDYFIVPLLVQYEDF